jgi:hypothetical protein
MPLFEYVLVALMGAAGHSAATPITNLGPEALAQPNGGALLGAQEPPKKEDGIRRQAMLTHQHSKYRHNKHRHGGRKILEPKKDGGKRS